MGNLKESDFFYFYNSGNRKDTLRMKKGTVRISRLPLKIASIFLFARIACVVVRCILEKVNAAYMQLPVEVFATPMRLLFLILCIEQIIYHSNRSKLVLAISYAVKLGFIYIFVREVHDVYVLLAQEKIEYLQKLLAGYGNGSPNFLSGVLASFAALIIFERVLTWMKDSKYSEWNPFSIADIGIHKSAGIFLSSVYFCYFCYGTLGYETYLSIAEKATLLCGLFTVFWVQYPMRYSNITLRIAMYIRKSAHLSLYYRDWLGAYKRAENEEQQRSYWMQSICLPLLRKVNHLMSYNWGSHNIDNKLEVIRKLLKFIEWCYTKLAQLTVNRVEKRIKKAEEELEKADDALREAEEIKNSIEAYPKSKKAEIRRAKADVKRATEAQAKAQQKVKESKSNRKSNKSYKTALITINATWMLSYIVGLGCAVSNNDYYLKRISREIIGKLTSIEVPYAFKIGIAEGIEITKKDTRDAVLKKLGITNFSVNDIPKVYSAHFSNTAQRDNSYEAIMDELVQELSFYGEK